MSLESGDQQTDLWCERIGSGGEQPLLKLQLALVLSSHRDARGASGSSPLSPRFQLLQGQASKQALAAEVKLPQVSHTSR